MPSNRRKQPLWRRQEPSPLYDIALLRPATLPKGERFETEQDVRYESERSEFLLRSHPGYSRKLAKTLSACREGDIICDEPYCPICARKFRRWFIGQLLHITQKTQAPVHIVTVLLEQAGSKQIKRLDPTSWRHPLRKRLQRSGLSDVPVLGGFEMMYRHSSRAWVLHINLVVVGGTDVGLKNLRTTFDDGDFHRPVVTVPLQDLTEQLSYVSKFTTYQRPLQQQGPSKGPATPLNAPEHHALVKWMSQYEFKDFLYLFNASREGAEIKVKTLD